MKESLTLVVRCIGYHPDTLVITTQHSIRLFQKSKAHTVDEVNVVGKRNASYLEYANPLNKTVVTQKELFKGHAVICPKVSKQSVC